MIEIIKEDVPMPPINERRYQKEQKGRKWVIIDTQLNRERYRGSYENVSIACHSLNKAHYLKEIYNKL